MTLIYDCPVDKQHDLEYCRNNVMASLGTMSVDPKTGKEEYHREIEPAPDAMNEQFEAQVYEYGHLWSPLKLYYRKLSRGPLKPWRLVIRALNRAEHFSTDEQQVTLLITLRSFDATDNVYDELVQEMNRLGWTTADLKIQSNVRGRN